MVLKYRSDSSFYKDILSTGSGIPDAVGVMEEILPKGKWKGILYFNYGLREELPN